MCSISRQSSKVVAGSIVLVDQTCRDTETPDSAHSPPAKNQVRSAELVLVVQVLVGREVVAWVSCPRQAETVGSDRL